ncbi:hypothetical protein BLNAU_17711 [Blattamonas nauphoetae]|uniref:Rap-GAP domain-containing protein n=1 Tax=Blattamonas nauphoetae TaxID=2049346 RepID=A0ABQ9X6C7_9EUKA|nr:hypothetical protein BLNAU_17711 [Blattamonas nauphoetae]
MEPSLVQISRNRHLMSWIEEYKATLRLLSTIFQLSPNHQPSLCFVCSSHIPTIFQSLLTEVEHDDTNQFIHWFFSDTLNTWKAGGDETEQNGIVLLQALEREGFRDSLERTVLHHHSSPKGVNVSLRSLMIANNCSPFLNWRPGPRESPHIQAAVFRSLVATVKLQPTLDDSLEATALYFLETVIPKNQTSADAFLTNFGQTTDESLTNFVQCFGMLVSSASQTIPAAAMKMLGTLIFWCSTKLRHALVKADLIPQIIINLNPVSLSFTETVDIHVNLITMIKNSVTLATPFGLNELKIEDGSEQQYVHETILKQVLVPSENELSHLILSLIQPLPTLLEVNSPHTPDSLPSLVIALFACANAEFVVPWIWRQSDQHSPCKLALVALRTIFSSHSASQRGSRSISLDPHPTTTLVSISIDDVPTPRVTHRSVSAFADYGSAAGIEDTRFCEYFERLFVLGGRDVDWNGEENRLNDLWQPNILVSSSSTHSPAPSLVNRGQPAIWTKTTDQSNLTIDRILLASESSPDRNFVFTTPFFFPSSAFPKTPIGVVACSVAVENGIVDIGQLDGDELRPFWTCRKVSKLTLDLSDAKSEVQRASGWICSWSVALLGRQVFVSGGGVSEGQTTTGSPSSLSETMRVGGGRMRKMPNVGTATPVTSLVEVLRDSSLPDIPPFPLGTSEKSKWLLDRVAYLVDGGIVRKNNQRTIRQDYDNYQQRREAVGFRGWKVNENDGDETESDSDVAETIGLQSTSMNCQRCSFIILAKALTPRDFSTLDIKSDERVRMYVTSSTDSFANSSRRLKLISLRQLVHRFYTRGPFCSA